MDGEEEIKTHNKTMERAANERHFVQRKLEEKLERTDLYLLVK